MIFNPNEQYDIWAQSVQAVRDSVDGETIVKAKGLTYLNHPDMIDQTSTQAQNRYIAYKHGAEFEEYTSSTERTMIGRMTSGEHDIELPDGISYLGQNSDGDGLPLSSMVELLYKNQLEVKFHILLSEMQSLAGLDTETLSQADLKALNPIATIKSYTRESLIDWEFSRINGVMQFSYMVLRESKFERNDSSTRTEIKTYLVLGLDDIGYYQQKYVEGGKGNYEAEGEKHYPLVGGSPLAWVPVQIACDESFPAGKLPSGLGFLGPISECAYDRYQMSADYKESLRHMQPTTFTSGWKAQDKELFSELNGRDYIAFGVGMANNLPEGVTVDVVGLGVQAEPYERYFEANERRARSLGAVFPSDTQNKSATESSIDDANATAAMVSIVSNTETALLRSCSYCAMFMGLWAPDAVEDNLDKIQINLFNDFGKKKLNPLEQQAVRDNVLAGMYSKDEGLRILVAGGATVSDSETIVGELESQGPDLPNAQAGHSSQDESLQLDQ